MLRLLALLLVSMAAQAQTLGIHRDGYLQLYKGDAKISDHTVEREAVEKAVNLGPGTYRIKQPDIVIVVKQMPPPPIGPVSWTREAWRAKVWENTLAWVALPGNREKMRWPTSGMYLPPTK